MRRRRAQRKQIAHKKTRQKQTSTKPQPQQPAAPSSAMPLATDTDALTPQTVIDMQRLIGNKAVRRRLEAGQAETPGEPGMPGATISPWRQPAIQRNSPGTATKTDSSKTQDEKGPTWEESLEVFKALSEILQTSPGFGYVVMVKEGLAYKRGFPAAYKKNVPEKYMHILHMWYNIAQGQSVVEIGPPYPIEGAVLLDHIAQARKATAPFAKKLLAEGDERTKPYLNDVYYSKIKGLIDRAYKEEAEQKVEKAGEQLGKLISPEDADKKEQTKRAIAEAISVLSTVSGQVNNYTGMGLDDAYKKILSENPPPGPVGDNLKGMKIGVAVGHLNDVLGALKAVSDISDPQYAKKLFDEKMGAWGYVAGGADLTANILTILQGSIAGVTGATAALSTVMGYSDEAAKLLAHSSKITGGLGKAIAVLTITKGVATIINDKASATDKASAAADIASGVGALIGGSVGAGLAGAALSFKINLSIIEKGVQMSRALISIDLRKAFATMKQQGLELSLFGNQVVAAQQLIANETDPIKKAYLTKEYQLRVSLLRSTLKTLVNVSTADQRSPSLPGYWDELRKRFKGSDLPKKPPMPGIEQKIWDKIREANKGIGSAPDENTPVEDLLKQAQKALEIMAEAFKEYENVLDQETYNAWKKHG